MSVCPPEYLHNHTSPGYLCPWLGPSLTALRYVTYFRFCGWRHACALWPDTGNVLHVTRQEQWRNDGVAAASSDGGPTGGRGPPTVLEFLVINFSVWCYWSWRTLRDITKNLQKANIWQFQFGSISYIVITYCCISYSLVNSLILNTFRIRFVVLLASDRLARNSKFLLI